MFARSNEAFATYKLTQLKDWDENGGDELPSTPSIQVEESACTFRDRSAANKEPQHS